MLGEVRMQTGVTILTLHGDLDLLTVDALRTMLDDIASGDAARVVIDLSDVTFVDVLSLSVILGVADRLREEDRQLQVRGASSSVRKVCALLNAEDILAPPLPLPRGPFVRI